MHRYGSTDYFLSAPYKTGIALINKALTEEQNTLLWQMWLVEWPQMTKDNFEAFTDYKNKRLGRRKGQTTEEMIAMARMLNAAFGGTEV